MDMQEIHNSLTKEEERAIASLRRLAKKWPQSLWLFSQNGALHVMKKNTEGEMAEQMHLTTRIEKRIRKILASKGPPMTRAMVSLILQTILDRHIKEWENCPYTIEKDQDGDWIVVTDVTKLKQGIPNFSVSDSTDLAMIIDEKGGLPDEGE